MKIGTYVSGAGHAGLFVWLLIGGFFVSRDDFDAIRVTDVSIVSTDEFQALQPSGPETGEAPPALPTPATEEPAPALTEEVAPAAPSAPAAVEEVIPDAAPAPVEEPVQPVDVPIVEPEQPQAPEGTEGDIVVLPDAVSVPRQADRVAPEAALAPEPDATVAEEVQVESAPDAAASVVEEAVEATAPEEAATEIVTEADEPEPSAAPVKSTRPGRKPTPPTPAPTEVAETPTVPGLAESINGAISEANSDNAVTDNANPGGGSGEPITRAEKGAFILGIQKCWNVGALSTDALKVTVTVGFTMTQDAKPEIGSIRLVGAEGGSGGAVDRAYEAARRAIIRCGSAGFGLPADKYNQWRGVEVRFNATNKEIR
ncbi:hypothetical protein N9M66_03440 [Litoreibacter sp.]|nr:hypothetical protein [Litoreibacter sp.]